MAISQRGCNCTCVGVPLEADGSATETIVNTSAIDVLRRLPGVTEGNYRPLMKAAGRPQNSSAAAEAISPSGAVSLFTPDLAARGVVLLPDQSHKNLGHLHQCL